MVYAKKFTVLKYINLYILPSWNNVLAVAYLLQATPYVGRLRLEVRPKCSTFFLPYSRAMGNVLSPVYILLPCKVRLDGTTSYKMLVVTGQILEFITIGLCP
jgi:hypothetical protein